MQMVEHVFFLTFMVSIVLAYRLSSQNIKIPYTAACFPVVLLLLVRFAIMKQVFKALKNTYNLLKYLF